MNETNNKRGSEPGTQSQQSSGTPIYKTWGFWIGVIVLLCGEVWLTRRISKGR